MNITEVTFSKADESEVLINTSEGDFRSDYPLSGWQKLLVDKWLGLGNSIKAWVAPADWTGFRHWMHTHNDGKAIMQRILTSAASNGAVGVINGWLMYELSTDDLDGVRKFVGYLTDAGVVFSETEKSNANAAAVTYNLSGPIFIEE